MRRISCALALAALAACSSKEERTVSRIEVTPAAPTIATGSPVTFGAVAVYSDGGTSDVSALATWTSDAPSVLSVSDAAGTKGVAQALAAGTARVTATFEGVSGSTDATVDDHGALLSIVVLPAKPAVVVGGTVALFAMGTYADSTVRSVNASATWSSDAPAVATVSDVAPNKGTVTGRAVGTATIKAAVGLVQGSATVSVSDFTMAALRIAPDLVMVTPGGTAPVQALARDAGGAEVDVTSLATWSSDATAVATVTGGVVSGVSTGVAHLSAVHGGKTATASVVVQPAYLVALRLSSAAAASVGVGFNGEIRAFGLYSDLSERDVTDLATWTSEASPIVQVSDAIGTKGAVHAVSAGTANVTASFGGLSATTAFTVAPRAALWVLIDAVPSPLPIGASQQLRATATYDDFTTEDVTDRAVWSSSSAAVGVSASGLATASAAGTAVVSASYGGCSAYSFLTVAGDNPTALRVALNDSTLWQGQYTFAMVSLSYPDGLVWDVSDFAALTSLDATVASIGAWWNGSIVRAVGAGATSIQASYAGLTASAPLTVDAVTALSIEAPAAIPLGATAGASAYGGSPSKVVTSSAEWSSSDPTVLTVTNTGLSKASITAVGAGTATITATFAGLTASQTITVRGRVLSIAITPESKEIVERVEVVSLTATATLEDGTLDVTSFARWSSDYDATYVFGGLVLGNHPGASLVSAEMGGVIGHALVMVLPEPPLDVRIVPALPDPVRLPPGSIVTFSADAEYRNFTRRFRDGVTWTSSDPLVAAFSTDPGKLTVLGKGTTYVTAKYAEVLSLDRMVIVDDLISAGATPTMTVPAGGWVELPLTATFAGGTSDVSPLVTWTTTDPTDPVAIVKEGLLFGMRQGNATVSASFGGFPVSTSVTVVAPTVTSLDVSAPAPTIALGAHGPVKVVATLSNGDHVSVSGLAALSTSGTVSVTGTTTVQADAVGSGTVQASYLGQIGSYTVTVESGVPWLQVKPFEARAAVGTVMCPYVTTAGTFAVSNVTELASYATSNASVAQPQLSGGCTTAAALGTALVTASYGGKTASMLVVVEPVVAPPEVHRLWGDDGPVHVFERAEYEARTDHQTEPVTRAATWASGDAAVAKVVGPGVFEGVAPGFATATASIGGFTTSLSTSFWVRVLPASLVAIELQRKGDPAQLQRWAIAVPAGASYPLIVKATYSDGVSEVDVTGAATFSSEDTAVAAFDAGQGVLHAVGPGVTHVQAQVGLSTVRIPVTVF